jgi:hypothetical protein
MVFVTLAREKAPKRCSAEAKPSLEDYESPDLLEKLNATCLAAKVCYKACFSRQQSIAGV